MSSLGVTPKSSPMLLTPPSSATPEDQYAFGTDIVMYVLYSAPHQLGKYRLEILGAPFAEDMEIYDYEVC